MTLILKQSTAIDIRMGVFVDVTDGVTPETAITLAGADQAEVLKANGAATVAMAGAFVAVTGADGWYDYTAATTDVDTVGEVVFVVQDLSVCLPVYVRGYVVEEAVYDAMYGAASAGPLQSTTAGRTLDVLATGEVPIDFDTSIGTLAAAQIEAAALNGKGDWNIGKTGYSLTQAFPSNFADMSITVTTGLVDITQTAADKVWASASRTLTALGFSLAETDFTAAALRQLGGLLFSGTADAGGTSTTIDDAALTEADDIWAGNWVLITSGTSANQCRLITDFDAATDVLTFAPAVSSAIGAGVTYEIYANAGVDVQSWLGTLSALAAPNALVGGAVDSDVSAMQANVITAAAINAAAITAAKFAAGAIDANALAPDAVDEIRDGLLPTQNAAFNNIPFLLVAASDHVTPVTAATGLAVTRSIDGGAFGAGTGAIAEIANGMYQYDASAADMNGGVIIFRFTATGGTPGAPDDAFVPIVTGGGV